MNLVGLEVKAPNESVARYARGHCCIVRGTFRQIIPQPPCTEPSPRTGQLYFGEQPVPTVRVYHVQLPPDIQRSILGRCPQNPNQERGKLLKRSRRRRVLPPQGGKAVVCRDKQIVAGDPGLVVERRPVRLHHLGIWLPVQLLLVRNRPPGLQRPDMHSHGLHLATGPGERAGRTLPEEAFTSSVICCERPGRAEGVIDKNVGAQLCHKP